MVEPVWYDIYHDQGKWGVWCLHGRKETRDGEVDKNLYLGCWVLVVGDRDVVFVGRLWLGVQRTRYACIIDACGVRFRT